MGDELCPGFVKNGRVRTIRTKQRWQRLIREAEHELYFADKRGWGDLVTRLLVPVLIIICVLWLRLGKDGANVRPSGSPLKVPR